ncbi:N5-carboxyaminoimidazole ribonucleotide synthase [Leptospira kobayashii]|uniref:N5-carboxyaminoimidazole ribonucleotide synthase n=1 Tax=Leptospira kobayashii TaxID=1917830 RepID=A0ABN6KD30_9LEPT|nr:5-(carboxyamino)imidazole ribonucleotide synthase [Leptospira kobayashii]BDA78833.1 N5-carboxyaminoimidazole ribonucleotide synthase [Leptospira kobayashii]
MAKRKIGILGSGQLGQMMIQEANLLGFDVICYSPDSNSPSKKAGALEITGEYSDHKKLSDFLSGIDVLSFEFENIPSTTLDFLEEYSSKNRLNIYPPPSSLKIAQDRFLEKSHFLHLGLKTPKFHHLTSSNANDSVSIPFPWIIKTLRFGYDGKGQVKVTNDSEFSKFKSTHFATGREEYLIEEVIPFDLEISVILSRFTDGESISYGTIENIHKHHILDVSIFPARVSGDLKDKAVSIAKTLADSLSYVGTVGVEFFVKNGDLYLNEFAPRPHNSGHFSQDCGSFSQFLLHILAITNQKFPTKFNPEPTVMKNILGHEYTESLKKCFELISDDRYRLHLYSKEDPRVGRKMGHINFAGKFEDIDPLFFTI